MKRIKYVLAIILLTLMVSPSFAQYQDDEGDDNELGKPGLGFGPQVGYYKSGDADDGRFMFGLALRARLNVALGVEASINYRQEEYGNGAVTVRSWPVMVTAQFFPLPIVYAGIGGGWYNTTYDYSDNLNNSLPPNVQQFDLGDETKQQFGWHLAAGLELPVSPTARITGDFKYIFMNSNFKSFAQTAVNNDLSSDFYVISLGVLFGF